jgi:general secretion pathway protein K
MAQPDPKKNDRQRGFVLVAVIWLAGLIAVMATGFIAKVRIDALLAANAIQAEKSELIADGMARLTAWHLAKGDSLPGNGASRQCRWRDTARVEVRIQDQAGLADLNTMPDTFFTTLFKALGKTDEQSLSLAQAINDFRDPDSDGSNGVAEPSLYAGQSFGPKNAPFEAVEELDQIPGFDEALYRAVLPLVTVHSSQPGIDPSTAPATLRKLFKEPPTGDFTGQLANFAGASQARAFAIDIRVEGKGGGRFRREAIIVVLRQPERPFAVLEWKRGQDWGDDLSFAASAPACFN